MDNLKITVHGFNVEKFDYFLGRVLTIIETLGLPQSQEKAVKDLVRQEVWYLWEHPRFIEEKETLLDGKSEN